MSPTDHTSIKHNEPAQTPSTINQEIWKDIPGWIGDYQVSNLGRVKSLTRTVQRKSKHGKVCRFFRKGKILSAETSPEWYRTVTLCRPGFRKAYKVCWLVLATFIGPRPKGMEACHNDGNHRNDCLINLRWGTHKENVEDMIRHGTSPDGERNGMSLLKDPVNDIVRIHKLYNDGQTVEGISILYKLNIGAVHDILRGRSYKRLQPPPEERAVMRSSGRKGSRHPKARLTEDDVTAIRRSSADGETYSSLSRKYQMHRHSIRAICIGKTWRHVT